MFESIFEDGDIPIIWPSFMAIDDMYEYLQLGLIGVILDNFDNLCFWYIFILYGQSAFHFFIHFFGHEVETFDLWNQINELFLQLYLLFFYEEVFHFFCVSHALVKLELVLGDDVSVVADDCLDLQLSFHLVLLFFYLYFYEIWFLLCLELYHCHLLFELFNLFLF